MADSVPQPVSHTPCFQMDKPFATRKSSRDRRGLHGRIGLPMLRMLPSQKAHRKSLFFSTQRYGYTHATCRMEKRPVRREPVYEMHELPPSCAHRPFSPDYL